MKENKKRATEAARVESVVRKRINGKDNLTSRIIQQVRQLFISGGKFTAKQINEAVGFNDARKVISVLRNKENWNIQDFRQSNGCKVYWLVQNDSQLSLF